MGQTRSLRHGSPTGTLKSTAGSPFRTDDPESICAEILTDAIASDAHKENRSTAKKGPPKRPFPGCSQP